MLTLDKHVANMCCITDTSNTSRKRKCIYQNTGFLSRSYRINHAQIMITKLNFLKTQNKQDLLFLRYMETTALEFR